MATWPFPDKNPGQFRRIDDGWDLQYKGTTPVPVSATGAGTVSVAPSNPGGFGSDYPLLKLDNPVTVGGRTFDTLYYGHTHVIPSVIGQHVAEGAALAMTGGASSGGNAAGIPNWLEIGFWPPSNANGPLMRDFISGGGVPAPAGTTPLGAALGQVTGLGGLFDAVNSLAADFANVAKIGLWFVQPANDIRVLFGFFGLLFLGAGAWMLSREVRPHG